MLYLDLMYMLYYIKYIFFLVPIYLINHGNRTQQVRLSKRKEEKEALMDGENKLNIIYIQGKQIKILKIGRLIKIK